MTALHSRNLSEAYTDCAIYVLNCTYIQELHVPMERVASLAAPLPSLLLLRHHHVCLLRLGQVGNTLHSSGETLNYRVVLTEDDNCERVGCTRSHLVFAGCEDGQVLCWDLR
jgi:hypothetical protein